MIRTVVHVTTGLGIGGAERMLLRLLESQQGGAWQHRVVSLRAGGELRDEVQSLTGPVVEIGVKGAVPGPLSALRLRRAVARHAPALVLGWMYHGNLAAWSARGRAPVLWNIRHSVYDLGREKWATALVIRAGALLSRRAGAVIYNSQVSAAQHARLGYAADRAIVIPNGFDLARFRPQVEACPRLHAQLGADNRDVLIGIVARAHELKGYRYFLEAAERVQRQAPQARFVLVGAGTEALLAEWQRTHGASLRAHALGEVRAPEAILAGLDLLVSSSISEGFPNAVGEAMASGVPCVVTDVGDSGHLLGDPDRTVPPGDSVALARVIERLVSAGPEVRRVLGEAGRRRVVQLFSLAAVTARYTELFDRLEAWVPQG